MKAGRLAFPLLLILILGTLGCGKKGDTGPMGPQGPAGPSTVLGFASLDGNTPAVYNFGGGRTTAVTVNRISTGYFEVTLTGDYTGVAGLGDITVLATISNADDFAEHANAAMADAGAAANATTIVVPVRTEFDYGEADLDFSVVVLTSK